jgi:hypothetical protein
MRAVWSFWAKPFTQHHRLAWASEKYHLLAWVLSVETARRHYPVTSLVTDDEGARMLVDGLGLEFAQVSTALNALRDREAEWWALGKLYAYRAQAEPFIHLDNDVFLWKRLPPRLEAAPLFAQNPEYFVVGESFYRPQDLEAALSQSPQSWLPEEWRWFRARGGTQEAANCGIFGGAYLDFIHYYADRAIRLIQHPKNQLAWPRLSDKIGHTVLFEQYLLSACVEYHRNRAGSPHRGLRLEYLFESVEEAFQPERAAQAGFTHIWGAKSSWAMAQRVERRVQRDYPQQYERCLKYHDSRRVVVPRPVPRLASRTMPLAAM